MKEIFIERQNKLLRIAIKEDSKLKECFIEEESDEPYPGQIYKGVIKNIVPAIKCAFIDIGTAHNAYMYLDSKFGNTKFKKGQELLVEVIKEEIGNKGAKVTNAISIPGRYVVLETLNREITFSKKIEDADFIKDTKERMSKPEDIGVMVRTNGVKVPIEELNKELEKLHGIYTELLSAERRTSKPKILFSDDGALQRTLRDIVDENTKFVYVNNDEDYTLIKEFIENKMDIETVVKIHEEVRSLFDYYGIEKEILSLRNNKVALHCGGTIVIDKTEAMYVIDVNSGKNVKQNSVAKTAYETNMEAAEEVGRQIRLRNLNGIIVVDFIDMEDKGHRQRVLKTLIHSFEGDKNKTVVYPFTELNLVQIARRRRGKSIYAYIEEACDSCKGKGKRLRLSYITLLLKNEIIKIEKEQNIKDIYIELDVSYEKAIREDILTFVKEIEGLDKKIYVNFVKGTEYFKIEPLLFANQIRNLQIFKIYG